MEQRVLKAAMCTQNKIPMEVSGGVFPCSSISPSLLLPGQLLCPQGPGIVESCNGLDWEGPSKVIQSNSTEVSKDICN